LSAVDDFAIPARVGATVLRQIHANDQAISALPDLYAGAYTVMDLGDREKRERFEKRLRERLDEPGRAIIGASRDGRLVGAMAWYDFTMRLRATDVFAGGLGAVAVALDARRRGVGHDLVRAFVTAYRKRGATLALLHPFRHDFYRRLGFGHGTKLNRYRLPPLELPEGGASRRVRQVDATAADAVAACYERVRLQTNGLIASSVDSMRRQLDDKGRAFAYFDEAGTIRGYMLTLPFVGAAQNSNANELRVLEPIAEYPAVLAALLTFLRDLGDQFRYVILETQRDAFHIVPKDPRDESGRVLGPPAYHETNAQGAGVMYRVLDVPRALEALAAGGTSSGRSVWASLAVTDALLSENSEAFDLAIEDDGSSDAVSLALDVAEFSSLVVGAVRLRSLYEYGLATVSSPSAVSRLDRLFAVEQPPLCTTSF
jgi:predicted acetyltransferase